MMIFGAGIIGKATLQACRLRGINVDCFLDEREHGSMMGVEIRHPSEVTGASGIYLTSPYFKDMAERAKHYGLTGLHSCAEVIERDSPWLTEHERYLVESIRTQHAGEDAAQLMISSVDIVVTERCTLKCADCSNLMQYYEHPQNQVLYDLLRAIDQLCDNADCIHQARVIGGEPLVNKDCGLVVRKLLSRENVETVAIFTNGTLLPRDWNNYEHSRVRFYITDYGPLSRKSQELVAELKRRGISYVIETADNWTACSQIISEPHDRNVFEHCCAKHLTTLMDGRLYRCPFSAHVAKLQAIPDYAEDYLNIKEATKEDIRRFIHADTPLGACAHCAGRSHSDAIITPAVQVKYPLKYTKYARHGD